MILDPTVVDEPVEPRDDTLAPMLGGGDTGPAPGRIHEPLGQLEQMSETSREFFASGFTREAKPGICPTCADQAPEPAPEPAVEPAVEPLADPQADVLPDTGDDSGRRSLADCPLCLAILAAGVLLTVLILWRA